MLTQAMSQRGTVCAITSRFVVAAVAFVAMAPAVSADTILGNYPPANDSTQSADIDNLRLKAMRFTMPAGIDYLITSVTLRLGNYDLTDVPILEIRDFNGTTTSPGAGVVGSFTAPAGSGTGIFDYIFTPSGSITLQAGTSYWILLRGDSSATSVNWHASSPGITPTGIATFGPGNLFTANGGTSWSTSSILNSFIIEGTPVPGSAALALLGVAGLFGTRRRRRV